MFELKKKPNRNFGFLVQDKVVATYTVDQAYVGTYDLVGEPALTLKILPAGYVVAFNPATKKIVPNYTVYGFGVVGITIEDVNLGASNQDYHDREVSVLWRGIVLEDFLWDNGDYGSVLQATKTALVERISFVDETGLTQW